MDILNRITAELGLERPCLHCGRLYPGTHVTRFYCTTSCSRKAARKRKNEREAQEEQARRTAAMNAIVAPRPAPQEVVKLEDRTYTEEPTIEFNRDTPRPNAYAAYEPTPHKGESK